MAAALGFPFIGFSITTSPLAMTLDRLFRFGAPCWAQAGGVKATAQPGMSKLTAVRQLARHLFVFLPANKSITDVTVLPGAAYHPPAYRA